MSRFVNIATVYSGTQAGLIIALLEGCGIDVLIRDFHSAITMSNNTHAIGGIRLCVPEADEEEALDILANSASFDSSDVKPWAVPILIFGFLFAGVPPPGTGVILHRSHTELVFG